MGNGGIREQQRIDLNDRISNEKGQLIFLAWYYKQLTVLKWTYYCCECEWGDEGTSSGYVGRYIEVPVGLVDCRCGSVCPKKETMCIDFQSACYWRIQIWRDSNIKHYKLSTWQTAVSYLTSASTWKIKSCRDNAFRWKAAENRQLHTLADHCQP